jgi:hypothetical protein
VITVSLIGGLGNQMFQYAAGKALAERHGVSLALDVSGFRDYALRSFLLDHLCVPEAVARPDPEFVARQAPERFTSSLWRQRLDRVLGLAGLPRLSPSLRDYREPHFHYDPTFGSLGPDTVLFGYFQSERYFSSIAEKLVQWFAPREPLSDTAKCLLSQIDHCSYPVSVHVRRGDYLNAGTAEVHGILAEPYYRKAIGRIEAELGAEAQLFVFSDDAVAAEKVLNFVPSSRLVHVRGDPLRPWEDMSLMARCRHHIIANSSFSWWGAWLNQSADKLVVAPSAWFAPMGQKDRDTSDLYPRQWIVL